MKKAMISIWIIFLTGLFLTVPTADLALATSGDPDVNEETDRVLVKVTDNEGNEFVESVLTEELGQAEEDFLSDESSVLYEAQEVETLEPDFRRYIAIQPVSTETMSWGTERIGITELKSKTAPSNERVIVAVIDTGVDYTHPFLKGRMVQGYDVVADDTDPMDVHFHGTHVAGIIADTTPANVKIMPIRVMDEEGRGYDSDIAKGIRYAVDNGADIINMSFVGQGYSQYLADTIQYALSNNVLVIAAAGNEKADTSDYYPASEQKIIVVSATDNNDRIAQFSNTGSSIDVSAPGVDIVSTIPQRKFGSASGTSMAAPYVSGVAAMLKMDDPSREIPELERLLKVYVDDRGTIGWDPLYGEGIINFTEYANNPANGATEFIQLPEVHDVPLDKVWSIKFNRELLEQDIVNVKLLQGTNEIPIQTAVNPQNKEIITTTPLTPFKPNSSYRLLIKIENGENYEMVFTTGYK
ncbi:S8 family serine peptidase [Sporosarcina sp. ACRSM]|uniref:S8 family peptidase n=1 Tax=Sporosarcina sp. ACRSM TaxID=2918216 RepID=UPI001EF61C2A|nr:S8 family serine peptidase [Sporosarcina sp. ACRSM]MCG7337144.1 S8 family serine peptidase [Sporosarcina sp. ACRSM]